jgi:hypothetical protein
MQITIDTTKELSDLDKSVLRTLLGHSASSSAPATAAEAEEPTVAKAAAPAKKAAAPAKKAAAPKPDPEPEPGAARQEPDEDLLGSDGPTMEDAVALATKLVHGGEAARVKAALADAGAKRVSELKESDIADFVATLS